MKILNKQAMSNKEVAKIVNKAFNKLFKELTTKARSGDKKAALEIIKTMTAHHVSLKELGYMTTDNGRLVKYKKNDLPDYDLIMRCASGDTEAAAELLKSMTE